MSALWQVVAADGRQVKARCTQCGNTVWMPTLVFRAPKPPPCKRCGTWVRLVEPEPEPVRPALTVREQAAQAAQAANPAKQAKPAQQPKARKPLPTPSELDARLKSYAETRNAKRQAERDAARQERGAERAARRAARLADVEAAKAAKRAARDAAAQAKADAARQEAERKAAEREAARQAAREKAQLKTAKRQAAKPVNPAKKPTRKELRAQRAVELQARREARKEAREAARAATAAARLLPRPPRRTEAEKAATKAARMARRREADRRRRAAGIAERRQRRAERIAAREAEREAKRAKREAERAARQEAREWAQACRGLTRAQRKAARERHAEALREDLRKAERHPQPLRDLDTIGKWTVADASCSGSHALCTCACGTVRAVAKHSLKRGESLSCGECVSHIGQVRGHWRVLEVLGHVEGFVERRMRVECIQCGHTKTMGRNQWYEGFRHRACIGATKPLAAAYGDWQVLDGTKSRVPCRCSCGVERIIPSHRLRSGESRSCGHEIRQRAACTVGQTIGDWLVLELAGQSGKNTVYRVRCVRCGRETQRQRSHIVGRPDCADCRRSDRVAGGANPQ